VILSCKPGQLCSAWVSEGCACANVRCALPCMQPCRMYYDVLIPQGVRYASSPKPSPSPPPPPLPPLPVGATVLVHQCVHMRIARLHAARGGPAMQAALHAKATRRHQHQCPWQRRHAGRCAVRRTPNTVCCPGLRSPIAKR
jgi:hypothetical protein